MDFEEFEALEGKPKVTESKKTCCGPLQDPPAASFIDGVFEAYDDWEDWMAYGGTASPRRDHYGFRLPYRTRNEM